MHILDLAVADGLTPEKVASTNGGEYHSPCPACGGKDRFIIWEKLNRYYCRRCKRRGDSIQYLRDFHALSYKEACKQLRISPKANTSYTQLYYLPPAFIPIAAQKPNPLWKKHALHFVLECQKLLLQNTSALMQLYERGFTLGNIELFHLGLNPKSLWPPKKAWGLDTSSSNKLWLPKGMVIPTFDSTFQEILKIKIRRDARNEGDRLPKYVEITGSMKAPSIYGNSVDKAIIILESELDAMLVQQFAGDLCTSIALGGASKKPDAFVDKLVIDAPVILYALDVDPAGASALRWWKKTYPRLMLWPPPIAKSPGDALKLGINLRRWVFDGIHRGRK